MRKIKKLHSLLWFLKHLDYFFKKPGLLRYNLYAVKFTLFMYEVQQVLAKVFSCVTATTERERVHSNTAETFWCPIVVSPTARPWQQLVRFLSLLFFQNEINRICIQSYSM